MSSGHLSISAVYDSAACSDDVCSSLNDGIFALMFLYFFSFDWIKYTMLDAIFHLAGSTFTADDPNHCSLSAFEA